MKWDNIISYLKHIINKKYYNYKGSLKGKYIPVKLTINILFNFSSDKLNPINIKVGYNVKFSIDYILNFSK